MQAARWITHLADTDFRRRLESGLAWQSRRTDTARLANVKLRATGTSGHSATARATDSQVRPRARVSITVARNDAEQVRRALFRSLCGRIKQLVIVLDVERGTREPMAALELVLERGAVDEALKVAMASAPGAKLGKVLFL
jgi:hypothetical protein